MGSKYYWCVNVFTSHNFGNPKDLSPEISHCLALSTFPWAGLEDSAMIAVFSALIVEFAALVLLNFNLIQQLKLLGESASKALISKV